MRAADATGAVGTRPEHHASRKYSILALEGSTGYPAAADPLESGDGPEETGSEEMDTVDTAEPDRQRALPLCGQPEGGGGVTQLQHLENA